MLYMIAWKSLDVKTTTSLFASGVMDFIKSAAGVEDAPKKLKLISSVHVVGQPRGWVTLDAEPAEIHQLVVSLPPDTVELEVSPVIDDNQAKTALDHRHSAYKLK